MVSLSEGRGRWLIFGAGGFIGGALARELGKDGEVLALSLRGLEYDHEATLREQLPLVHPGDSLIAAAAASPDSGLAEDEIIVVNVRLAGHVAILAAGTTPHGVVLFSSIDLYGHNNLDLPLHEQSDTAHPAYGYPLSKHGAEFVCKTMCSQHAIPLLTLRLPGVYGPGDTHRGPVRSFIDAAMKGEAIHIHGDGNQRRDLLFVDDVAQIVRAWRDNAMTLTANAVTGTSFTLNELADVIEECAGRKVERIYHEAPQYDLEFEPSALLRHYPQLRFTPMRDGVRQTWERLHAHAVAAP